MQNPLRILLLGICATLGLTIAIAVALQQAPESEGEEFLQNSVAGPLALAKPAHPLPPPEPPSAPLAPAPPTVVYTSQIKSLEETIDVMQRSQQRQQRQLAGALDDLRDQLDAKDRRLAQAERRQTPPDDLPPPAEPPAAAPSKEKATEELEPGKRGRKMEREEGDGKLTLTLQDSDIRDILDMLGKDMGLNIVASKSVTGTVTATLIDVDAETALAAILKSTGFIARQEGNILYIGTPADLDAIDQALDRIITRIYRPNYVRAADLNMLITSLLTPSIGKVTVSAPSAIDNPADQVKTGGDSFTGTEVVIVRDYEAVVLQIDDLVQEVDVRPRQVSIEAMILSVKLSDTCKMGINFHALRTNPNTTIISGVPPTNLTSIDNSAGGVKLGFLDSSLALLLDALETVGDTNVIASPRLMCLNKQRAEIQIGEQLGYVNTTVTENASTQTVAFLDVGTLLRIRPNIASDHMVRLEIHPEVSAGSVTVQSGLTLPNKSVTQVTTNVMCPDGATLVLGGLIKEDVNKQITQIPWLGSLPIAGPFFKAKQDKVERIELVCLLTPHIVGEETIADEGYKYGREFAEREQTVLDKTGRLSRRGMAVKKLRLARAAFAAGDCEAAMKHVNMSIHYDPQSRDATALRKEIICACGYEDESVHEYLKKGLMPWGRTHKDYSKQGYPWKNGNRFDDHPTPDTLTTGVPTPERTLVRQPPAPRPWSETAPDVSGSVSDRVSREPSRLPR